MTEREEDFVNSNFIKNGASSGEHYWIGSGSFPVTFVKEALF